MTYNILNLTSLLFLFFKKNKNKNKHSKPSSNPTSISFFIALNPYSFSFFKIRIHGLILTGITEGNMHCSSIFPSSDLRRNTTASHLYSLLPKRERGATIFILFLDFQSPSLKNLILGSHRQQILGFHFLLIFEYTMD